MVNEEQQHHSAQLPSWAWNQSRQPYPQTPQDFPSTEYTDWNPNLSALYANTDCFASPGPQEDLRYQQLQYLSVPRWPSMLKTCLEAGVGPIGPHCVQVTGPISSGPSLSSGAAESSRRPSRRTLTDYDRRQICRYAEKNPSAKQNDIGG